MTMINQDDYWLMRMINELAYQLPKVADVKSRARCRIGHDIRHNCDDAYRKLHLPCNERTFQGSHWLCYVKLQYWPHTVAGFRALRD